MNEKRNDFPMWCFHGVLTSAATAFTWRNSVDQGYCPWCQAPVSSRYNNVSKHLKACPKRPKNDAGL